MAVSLLIVDDHDAFRTFARGMFAAAPFEVAGDVADGESVFDAVRDLRPDVVLLDVQLPGIDGFEVARRLASEPGAPAVVLTSTRTRSELASRLDGAPVRGFIPKAELSPEALSGMVVA